MHQEIINILVSYINFQMDKVQLGKHQQVSNILWYFRFQIITCLGYKEQTYKPLITIINIQLSVFNAFINIFHVFVSNSVVFP